MAENVTWQEPSQVAAMLAENHYLGPTKRGRAWQDDAGCLVVSAPTSRRLPNDWLDLTRWCIVDRSKNAGSMQWARFIRAFRSEFPGCTTIVSYSDPSAGHGGALYRACNWWWAPTWHRLRPPPTGQGSWNGKDRQEVKDRWVFALQPDPRRTDILTAKDESILRKMPFARYREPGGADYKTWRSLQLAPDRS